MTNEKDDFERTDAAFKKIQKAIGDFQMEVMDQFGKSIGAFDLYRSASAALEKVLEDYVTL